MKKGFQSSIRIVLTGLGLMVLAVVAGAPASAGNGGISGGGGGSVPANPIDIFHITQATEQSKLLLTAWLNARETFYHSTGQNHDGKSAVWQNLFESSPNIFDVVSSLKIEVRRSAPCIDPTTGKDVDGSADAQKPGSVCISAFSLAKKLNDYDYEFETAALVLHEATHLLGTNEEDAFDVQKTVLYGLISHRYLDYFIRLKVHVSSRFERVGMDFLFLETQKPACAEARSLSRSYQDLWEILPTEDFELHPLRAAGQETTRQMIAKIEAYQDYVCANDPGVSESLRSYYSERYAKGFGPDTEVDSSTFISRVTEIEDRSPNPVRIKKIQDAATLKSELAQIKEYVVNRQVEIQQFREFKFALSF